MNIAICTVCTAYICFIKTLGRCVCGQSNTADNVYCSNFIIRVIVLHHNSWVWLLWEILILWYGVTYLTLVWRCTYKLWKLLVFSTWPNFGPCSLCMISAFITRAMWAGSRDSNRRSYSKKTPHRGSEIIMSHIDSCLACPFNMCSRNLTLI